MLGPGVAAGPHVGRNAGAGIRKKLHEHTDDEWNFVLDTNLNAMFRGARAVLPHFIKKSSGNIVTTASTFGLLASAEYPGYCATKAAIINLTREMALDYGPLGIRVNCVCPGAIETPRFRGFPPKPTLSGITEEQRKTMGSSNKALLRMGRPEEIAYGVLRTQRTYSTERFAISVKDVEGKQLICPTITFASGGNGPPVTITASGPRSRTARAIRSTSASSRTW